jgi:hypothetical protein
MNAEHRFLVPLAVRQVAISSKFRAKAWTNQVIVDSPTVDARGFCYVIFQA